MGWLEKFVGTVGGQVIVQLGALTAAFKLATIAASGFFSVMMKSTAIQATVMTFRGLATTISGKTGLAGALTTATSYFVTFLKGLNPITIALGVVATAILAYKAAMANTLKEAELLAVKNIQIVDSLDAYKGAMVETGEKAIKLKDKTDLVKGANDAYISTLERLIKSHPELKDKIELSIDAYERNNEVIKEFTNAAYAEKVQALVNLHKEYGDAAERARLWLGVWVDIKSGLMDLKNVFVGFFDMILTGIDMAVTGWGLIFIEIGKLVKSIPYVGDALSKAFTTSGEKLVGLKDKVNDFYVKLGEGSEKAQELTKKQNEVLDVLADGYVSLKGTAIGSYGEIKQYLEKIYGEEKALTDENIKYFIDSVTQKSQRMNTYSHEVKTSLTEMNAAWKDHYDKQDIDGKIRTQQAYERLQKQYKDYVEVLQKMVAASEISEEEMVQTALAWWDTKLQEYNVKEAKQTETLNKELTKRKEAYQKFADKIKAIEEKLAEDQKTIRQAYMTDEAIRNETMLAARQALADAVKAVAEAESEEDMERALVKISRVRELYSAIATEALNNSNQIKEIETSTVDHAIAESSRYGKERLVNIDELHKAVMEALQRETKTYEQESERVKDVETTRIEYLKAKRDLAAKEDIERIKNTFGVNSQQYKDFVEASIRYYGEEEAARLYGLENIEKKTAQTNDANTKSNKKTYDSMKTVAENAFGVIEGLLTKLANKFKTPIELKANATDATEKVDTLDKKVGEFQEKAEEPVEVEVDEYKASEAYKNLTQAQKDFREKAEKQTQLDLDNSEFLLKLGYTKEQIGSFSSYTKDMIAKGNLRVEIDNTTALNKLGDVKNVVEEVAEVIEIPKVYAIETKQPEIDIEALERDAESLKEIVEVQKTFELDTNEASTDAKDLKTDIETTQTTAEETTTLDIDATAAISTIKTVRGMLEALVNKKWTSVHNIIVNGLDKLKAAIAYHKQLSTTNTTSTHTIVVNGKGSTERPIMEKLAEVEGGFDHLNEKTEEGAEFVVDFLGSGSTTTGFSDKIESLKKQLATFEEAISLANGELIVDFGGMDGESTGGLTHAITKAKQQLADLRNDISEGINLPLTVSDGFTQGPMTVTIDTVLQKVKDKITDVTDAINKNNELGLDTTVAQKKLTDLQLQLDTFKYAYDNNLISPTNKYADKQYASGGRIPGYGGGDTVPAMLEKGEYIIRKEKVKEYGQGMLDSINNGVQKFAQGGLVQKFRRGGSVDKMTSLTEGLAPWISDIVFSEKDIVEVLKEKSGRVQGKALNFVRKNLGFKPRSVRGAANIAELTGMIIEADTNNRKQLKPRVNARLNGHSRVMGFIGKFEEAYGLGGDGWYASGGKIPGYGGGDTVPAMLEKGEFVIRKEAVKKYGINMFENMNSMMKGMRLGGPVVPTIQKFAQGGEVGGGSNNLSGQLHTINLNINDKPHTLYGDSDAVNGLEKTLRRAQLTSV